MNKRATIKDVARAAGVDDGTVSRVIHDDRRISDATKARVRKAIARLGYEPNLVARGLVQRRTRTLALITPEFHPYVRPLVRGVLEQCLKRDYAALVFAAGTWVKETEALAKVAQNWRVDGLLFYHLIRESRQGVSRDMRAMMANAPVDILNKGLQARKLNAVGVDNGYAMRLVVEHLAGLGHRRIGLLTAGKESVDGQERTAGFRDAMRRLGLKVDPVLVRCANFRESEGYREAQWLLRQRRPPTALVCQNDVMAFGAIHAAQDLGLEVPRDLAVTGFDDEESARRIAVPLTTIRPPMEEVGRQGVEMLLDLVDHPKRKPRRIILTPELVVRRSTDPRAPARVIVDRG